MVTVGGRGEGNDGSGVGGEGSRGVDEKDGGGGLCCLVDGRCQFIY